MELNQQELIAIQGESTPQKVDSGKLLFVFMKSIKWFLLIIFINFLLAFLYVRYTKPLYESSSEIKLDKEEQSEILGLNSVNNNSSFGMLSSEIELIKSRLFFNKVIDAVRLNPQYFTDGNILDDEKYRNPPFEVDYSLKTAGLYDRRISINHIDEFVFELSYQYEGETYTGQYEFGKPISTEHFKMTITPSERWSPAMVDDHYIIINSHEALLTYLENNLDVTPLNLEANTFKISFQDHNLFKAHDLVAAIDTLYYSYSLAEKNQTNNKKIAYLNQQLEETENKLENLEAYFEDFTITNKTVDLDQDVKNTLLVINSLDSQRIKLNDRLDEMGRLKRRVQQESIVNIPPDSRVYPPYLIRSIEELNLLIHEKDKLAISYRENTYTYKTRQKEVDLLKADMLIEVDEIIIKLKEALGNLSGQKRQLTRELVDLPSKSTAYNKAKRFYSLNEEIYLSLMQSKNEFEIAVAGSTTTIKILSPASFPFKAISPNQTIAYGAATAASILFIFIFLGLSYLSHNKINSLSELEKLTNVAVLGEIPYYKGAKSHAELIVSEKPKSAISESLRSIRTNIEFMLPDKGCKTLSITSTVGSEGKTFISANLGALIAMTGKKCIILDLDLRKPKVHLAFNEAVTENGMSTLLIGKTDLKTCIQSTSVENLSFIPAGPIPPNPSELLLRETFDDVIEELKGQFDVIIFDTPPVGLVTDGLLVMKKADLPLYVLKANYSERSYVENINRLVITGQFSNLSIIFNASTSSQSGYGSTYGYGRKHSYYDVS